MGWETSEGADGARRMAAQARRHRSLGRKGGKRRYTQHERGATCLEEIRERSADADEDDDRVAGALHRLECALHALDLARLIITRLGEGKGAQRVIRVHVVLCEGGGQTLRDPI
eukprot:scaffold14464_cov55-Phaeocystis_antarctica.AAC.2